MCWTANNCLNTNLHIIVFSKRLQHLPWHYYSSSSSKLCRRRAKEALPRKTKAKQRKKSKVNVTNEIKHSLTWGRLRGTSAGRRDVSGGAQSRIFNWISGQRNQSPGAQPNQTCPTQWGASAETSSDLWTSTSLCFGRGQGVTSTSLFGMFSPEGSVFKPCCIGRQEDNGW